MPPFFPAYAPNANAAAVTVVRGLACIRWRGGVAVSAVVSAVAAPGGAGQRDSARKQLAEPMGCGPIRAIRVKLS